MLPICVCARLYCTITPPFGYISLFARKDLSFFFFLMPLDAMHRIATHHYDGFNSVTEECDWCKLDKPPLLIATVMTFILSQDWYNSFFLHFNVLLYIFMSHAPEHINFLLGESENNIYSL